MVYPIFWVGMALAAQVPSPNAAAQLSEELHKTHLEILQRESSQLKALADRLATRGEAAGAREVKALGEVPEPAGCATRFVPLPELIPARKRGKGLANVATKPSAPASWQAELQAIRSKSAEALFDLAGQAASKTPKHYALADLCLRAVVDRMPDHPEARRLLGFVPHENGWATPFAVQHLKNGEVFHPPYGWVHASWVPHLQQGELPAPLIRGQKQPRWVSAEEADRLHGDFSRAWQISTEHFRIRTNVRLADAIAFGQQLETFHDLFFSVVGDVFGDALPLARRFRDKRATGEPGSKLHDIHYFSSKEEYVATLAQSEGPDIAHSLGIYIPSRQGKGKRGVAYFFHVDKGELPITATLYHEVSHQLLFESGLGDPRAFEKNDGNYWVFEGLGTYFETVESKADGSIEVGGLVGRRIEEAGRRLVGEKEYIPLAQFVRYDQNGLLQQDPHLKYQEANALAVFFMQYDHELYREEFLDYVRDAAQGRLKRTGGKSLEERVGESYKTLDTQFLEFLKKGTESIP